MPARPVRRSEASLAAESVETLSFRWYDDQTIEVVFAGHVTGAGMQRALPRLSEMLQLRMLRQVLIDASQITSYTPDVREPGRELFRLLNSAGAQITVAITPSPIVRMMGAAVALATGTRIRFVPARAEAITHLERMNG